MKRDYDDHVRLYNILLPIWLLVFWPSYLWLLLIPANYLLDRIVLRWSLGDMPEKGLFCRRHTWKICLAGFLSDFAGMAVLFAVFMIGGAVTDGSEGSFLEDALYGVGFQPFSSVLSFVIVTLAVAVAAGLIYLLDRKILTKAGLTLEQAKHSAIRLALITAPYLYYFPSGLLYGTDWI